MKRLLALLAALSLGVAALAVPAGARSNLSCGSPTHLTFDNAHAASDDGYGSTGSTVQDGVNFTNMSVWSPDVRLPANATPTTSQTMDVCSNAEWNATVTETDNTPPNYTRVVTYPSSEYRFTQYDQTCNYQSWSTYNHLSSTWAIDAPAKGDWDESYDLWLGSFGSCVQSGIPRIELMTYTKWYQSVFAPTAIANFTLPDGKNIDAYWSYNDNGVGDCPTSAQSGGSTDGCLYIQTRLTSQLGSGTMHLQQIMQKLYANSYTYQKCVGTLCVSLPVMPTNSKLATIQYGPEVVSGDHTVADGSITFHLTDFSVTAN